MGDSSDVVGATVLVVRGDGSTETIEYGFADREAGVRTDADSQYRIGSIHKVYTAATVMSLAEDGLLAVDDPAADYVPSLPPEITIEHLLGHTSGLRDVDVTAGIIEVALGGGEAGDPLDSPLEVVDRGSVFEPGTRPGILSVGDLGTGAVIEAAAATTYEEALTEHLPLALRIPSSRTGSWSRPPPTSDSARPPRRSHSPTWRRRRSPATPAEPGPRGDRRRCGLLHPGALRRRRGERGVAGADDGRRPAPGWSTDSACRCTRGRACTVYGHNGRTIGFAASVRHDPATNTTVVVLANDGGAETSEFADQLIAAELARAAS